MFRSAAEQIANSHLSSTLQDALWVVPLSQSMHILALSVLFASVLMISLRLLDVGAMSRSVSQLAGTLLPWIWRANRAILSMIGVWDATWAKWNI